MSRREVARKFDDIVAFAEVERFLDTPVKHYSSGMYVRLAFAVAAHLEPEVLVVDEVLAVGDAAFQKKCLAKMGDVAGQGRTVLFVSHNMAAVGALCTRALLLEGGRLVRSGDVREVVAAYLEGSDAAGAVPVADRRDRTGVGRFRFRSLEFLDGAGRERGHAVTGEELRVRLEVDAPPGDGVLPVPLDVAVVLRDYQGHKITELATHFTGQSPVRLAEARVLTCRVPRLPLLAGQYRIDLWCGTSSETQDQVLDATVLRVEPGDFYQNGTDARLPTAEKHGCVMIPQQWGDAP
jgi:lipopolysaccharide transport system ATP-binding protein